MHWVPSQREAVARSGLDRRAPCKLGFRQSALAWIVAVTIVGLSFSATFEIVTGRRPLTIRFGAFKMAKARPPAFSILGSSCRRSARRSRSSIRGLIKNPVMFVVEVVAALTTVLLIRDLVTGGQNLGFTLPDHPLAVVHGAVRQLRRGGRRRPRQGAGRRRCAERAPRRRPSCSIGRAAAGLQDACPAPSSRSATSCWSRPATSSPPTAR